MAFSAESKVLGLFGLLSVATALVSACMRDFDGCASSACSPNGGGGRAGSDGATGGGATGGAPGGGESGSGAETGGDSGSGGTLAGAGGSDDGGMGGAGGSDDTTRPTIVSFTPEDGDSGVERDIVLTAELSERIDRATVTEDTVTLEGPQGRVAGTLRLSRNVISFAPDRPLNLLGTYDFTVAKSVADLAGNTLARGERVEFEVRDGRFSAPAFPFGTTIARAATKLEKNAAGDAVVGMDARPDHDSVYGAIYDAAANLWSTLGIVENATGSAISAGIDDEKRAVLVWARENGSEYRWSRSIDSGPWLDLGALPTFPLVGVTRSGLATAVWYDGEVFLSNTKLADLSDGSVDDSIWVVSPNFYARPVPSLDRMALIGLDVDGPEQAVAISWKEGTEWTNAVPVATAPSEIQYNAASSDEQGNIVVVWQTEGQVWARIYERSKSQWNPPHLVGTTTSYAIALRPAMTSGNAIVVADSLSATEGFLVGVYKAGAGWIENATTRLDDHGNSGMAVAIDPDGNALAVWQSELKYRRYIAGVGWQAPASLDATIDRDHIFSASAPDGSVLILANDLAHDANGIATTVRFE